MSLDVANVKENSWDPPDEGSDEPPPAQPARRRALAAVAARMPFRSARERPCCVMSSLSDFVVGVPVVETTVLFVSVSP
jgi:hypothetical protein